MTKIYGLHVFVGTNLFAQSDVDEPVSVEVKKTLFGRTWTVMIAKVASFNLDTLNQLKMEEHPVALNFINSVVKTCLR